MTTLPPAQRAPAVARVRRAVARAVDGRSVLRPGERVVVACSGGPDSSVLLDALARLAPPRRWHLVVAHVDHGLRPESAAEAEVVRGMASARGVEFRALSAVVEGPGSPQERARRARYASLRALAASLGGAVIACAHTADDQAETVLMRALTGATPLALAAMAARSGDVARPLLRVWRADVAAYCDAIGLAPLDDPSNRDPRYLRTRVRHELLPALEAVFPQARRRLVALADHQRRKLEAERSSS